MRTFIFKNKELKDYTIVNESFYNRSGFKHRSVLIYNNGVTGSHEVARNEVQYYNRTWECYEFQSSMSGLINNLKDIKTEHLKNQFKQDNNIKRLTEKTKKQLNEIVNNNEAIKLYNLMLNEIKGY